MQSGFKLATRGGISIAMGDMLIPTAKEGILAEASREVKEIDKQYSSGWRQGRQGDDGTTGHRAGCEPSRRRSAPGIVQLDLHDG
ncbi:hypothetical protein G6F46_015646 [Rhizopus delemar]|nr:hypothetical protein G6F46_015646 [Rhizopus delemar]